MLLNNKVDIYTSFEIRNKIIRKSHFLIILREFNEKAFPFKAFAIFFFFFSFFYLTI